MQARERVDGPDDAVLIEEILGGRRERYALLVERYQEPLFRHAHGMVGDPDAAADLVQEAFVKAYTSLASCQEPARFGAWVFRIVRNRCMDWLKDVRRQHVELDEGTAQAPAGYDPGEALERSELDREVRLALDALPHAQREAFLLKHVEGRSYEEMSEMLGASVSALKMRVMRAREVLQERLSGLRE